MSQPDDYSEREADRVMHEVMRSPVGKLSTPITKGLGRQTPSSKPQDGRHGKAQEGESNRFVREVGGSEVSPKVEGKIRSAVGSGRPLPAHLLDFFEPRFGRDLSSIRLHTDQSAASTSQSLQAAAFTFGSDIFFNAGQFSSDKASGVGLLAHELTHVTQQQAGGAVSRRLIQRAKLPYHQLTWADFKGPAPATALEAAGLLSDFETPNFYPVSPDTKNTRTKCKGEKGTQWRATIPLNVAQLDKLQAFMDQDKSWLQTRYQDDGKIYCTDKVTECESSFDKRATDVQKECQRDVTQCEQHFKSSRAEYRYKIGDSTLIISDTRQCGNMLLNKCREVLAKGSSSTVAKTRADCKTDLFKRCLSDEKAQKANLLKHEQGHFDITYFMVDKALAGLKDTAAKLNLTATRCGQDAASDAVLKSYDELPQLVKDWSTLKDKAQKDYDSQTTNGSKRAEQTAWEDKIKGKLKDYELPTNQPAPAPVTPTKAPATPTPTKPAVPKR